MASQIVVSKIPNESIIDSEPRYVSIGRPDDLINDGVEWRRIEHILRRHWKASFAFVLGLEVILLAISMLLNNTYEAHARLEISPAASETMALRDSAPVTPAQQDYIDTQSEILRSDYLTLKVIRDLNLDQNPTFYAPSWFGRTIKRVATVWSGSKPGSDAEHVDDLLKAFHSGLSVNQVKNSRLVDVAFESRDAQLSAAVVNDLVRQYLEDVHRSKYDSTLRAAESLAPELKDLKDSVDKSNQTLTEFQKTHEGTELASAVPMASDGSRDSAGQVMASNPIALRVAELNQQLTQTMGDRLQQESFIRLIEQGRNDVLPQMKDSPLIQELTKRLVDSRAQLAQALVVYGGNNPQVRKLQKQTEELSTQLNAERNRIADQIKASYYSAQVREGLLRKSMRDLKGPLDDSNANALRFDLMRREAQAKSNLYIATSSRIKELAVSSSLASNNIRILDGARTPVQPSGPHRVQILGAGLFLGLVGGLVVAFIAEGMDDTISTVDDVRKFSGMPALALLPTSDGGRLGQVRTLRGGPNLLGRPSNTSYSVPVLQFLREKPNSPEAEAIRSLETAIRISAQSKKRVIKTLLVTSAFPGEGKTTVATNLAAALSRHHKTCLIDADLRHPVVTPTYGLSKVWGLQDALVQPELVEQLTSTSPDNPNLTVLGAGRTVPNAIDKMTSEAMVNVIEKLKLSFEYIVIDSPPVIPFAESRWLSALADGIVVVVRCSATTRRALSWTMNILDDVQPQVLGVVLNGADLGAEYYAYGSGDRYYGAKRT